MDGVWRGVGRFGSGHGTFEGFPIVRVLVDGEKIVSDMPAINFHGRTMVPIRFVSRALGYDVSWGAETDTASISSRLDAL